ncbi:hypothetical protein [Salipiger bermudensis]|uniref:hypothetical protein n=1 Tax=Salipiger bermudensis TaxID=344736 RepID=UPI001CD40AF6|nr:hypothetical protein [Salipiger bermudensis]MCA0963277.1 hypothetical protein [Salipiger bermudensis]
MTIPTFPADLPAPRFSGYRSQRMDGRRQSSFDAGPPKVSRRYSAVARTVQLEVLLELWQKAKFDRFYIDDCAEGSRLFWMPDYAVDGAFLLDEAGLSLLDENDAPLLTAKMMLCQWGDAPPVAANPVLRRQVVSFSVVELPT